MICSCCNTLPPHHLTNFNYIQASTTYYTYRNPTSLALMNQTLIIAHAVLIGLTPLIPIPVLDDLVKSFFYRRLVELLVFRHKLTLSPGEVNILAEDRSRGLFNGCLLGTLEYIVKRLIRKLTIILEWR